MGPETSAGKLRSKLALMLVLMLIPARVTIGERPELTTLWERQIDSPWVWRSPFSPCLPAISEDWSIYVGSANWIYGLSGGGVREWKYDTNAEVSGVTIDLSGTIYVTSKGLLAFTGDRDLKWRIWSAPPGQRSTSAPALGADGRIYVLHGDHLLALTPQGTIDWAREVPSPYWEFSPVIGKRWNGICRRTQLGRVQGSY